MQSQGASARIAEASLSSTHLVPGEQCHLIVRMKGGEIDNRPLTPSIPDTAVNFVRSVSQINAQRQISTAFLYRVTPVNAGSYTVPPIALRSAGITYLTPELQYTVHPTSKLVKLPTGIEQHNILAGWFPDKTKLYQGEKCPVTLKLYIPQQLPIATNGWGIPDPAKDNCLAWRFSSPQTNDQSHVTIQGISYVSSTFDTTLSGISPGTATYGPAPLRLIVRRSIIDPIRGPRLVNAPLNLTIPAATFSILKLPSGAPADFNGAIGKFTIEAYSDQTTLEEEEPTEVILRIRGRGNLEAIKAPVLSNDIWKTIDSSKVTRGEERRSMNGAVLFRQLLRPQRSASGKLPDSIPAYRLSYFNPDSKTYHTLETAPIPVTITPSAKASKPHQHLPEEVGTDPSEMRGTLGFIRRPDTRQKSISSQLTQYWHAIPAILALALISIPIRKKIRSTRTKHPDVIKKEQALSELSQENDQVHFYKKAGHFVERWLIHRHNSETLSQHATELDHILNTRDDLCFQQEKQNSNTIKPEHKKAVLSLLKQCSKIGLLLLISHITFSSITLAEEADDPARKAWKNHHYQQALKIYQAEYPDPDNTPADILYNIGNCHHQLNQPGQAALAWRRALIHNPNHPQARQNLRFVELDQRANVPQYADWQQHLTRLSPSLYQTIFLASVWIFGLSILYLVILRPRGIKTTACIILILLSPVVASLGYLARDYYPDDHHFAPWDKQAVVIGKTQLYREAHRQENEPRDLPVASLVKIEASRGPWTYIQTADESNGWVPSKDLEGLLP